MNNITEQLDRIATELEQAGRPDMALAVDLVSDKLSDDKKKFTPQEAKLRDMIVSGSAGVIFDAVKDLISKLQEVTLENMKEYLEEKVYDTPDELSGMMSEDTIIRAVAVNSYINIDNFKKKVHDDLWKRISIPEIRKLEKEIKESKI